MIAAIMNQYISKPLSLQLLSIGLCRGRNSSRLSSISIRHAINDESGAGALYASCGIGSICRLCRRRCQVGGCGENNMALLSGNINCFDARNIHSCDIAYVAKSSRLMPSRISAWMSIIQTYSVPDLIYET